MGSSDLLRLAKISEQNGSASLKIRTEISIPGTLHRNLCNNFMTPFYKSIKHMSWSGASHWKHVKEKKGHKMNRKSLLAHMGPKLIKPAVESRHWWAVLFHIKHFLSLHLDCLIHDVGQWSVLLKDLTNNHKIHKVQSRTSYFKGSMSDVFLLLVSFYPGCTNVGLQKTIMSWN